MEETKNLQKNHFEHLPDDIILFVFDKIWEARWLCRCSMVSKRFASVISHVHNVSVKAPHYMSTWLRQEEGGIPSVSKFLDGLEDLVYLDVELPSFCEKNWPESWGPLLKWKLASFNTNVEGFTFVMATTLHIEPSLANDEDGNDEEEEEDEEEDEDEAEEEIDEEELQNEINILEGAMLLGYKAAFACYDGARVRLHYLLDTVEKHPMLRSITITDILKQGKMVVAGDRIGELRDLARAKMSMCKVDGVELLLKYCYIPALHLPRLERMMGGVAMVYIKRVEPSNGNGDYVPDDDILAGCFDGDDQGIFSEAVKEILANHKDKMNTGHYRKREIEVPAAPNQ